MPKKIHPIFYADADSGKLTYEDAKGFMMYLRSLKGRVSILIKRAYRKRTIPENSYYWGVIITMLAEEYGSNRDGVSPHEWWHEAMKTMFLKHIEYRDLGGIQVRFERIRSTAEESFSTVDAEEYYENIRRWAAEYLNFYIPAPNEAQADTIPI